MVDDMVHKSDKAQIDDDIAIELLKKHSSSEKAFAKVLEHSRAVQRLALKIAGKVHDSGHFVDLDFIRTASLLHDIGRFKVPPGRDTYMHGFEGAQILKKEGLDERYCRVCETHVGVGITSFDVKKQKMALPEKDYVPKTIEEKIICYADNLVFKDGVQSVEATRQRWADELGEDYGERFMALHHEITALKGDSDEDDRY